MPPGQALRGGPPTKVRTEVQITKPQEVFREIEGAQKGGDEGEESAAWGSQPRQEHTGGRFVAHSHRPTAGLVSAYSLRVAVAPDRGPGECIGGSAKKEPLSERPPTFYLK